MHVSTELLLGCIFFHHSKILSTLHSTNPQYSRRVHFSLYKERLYSLYCFSNTLLYKLFLKIQGRSLQNNSILFCMAFFLVQGIWDGYVTLRYVTICYVMIMTTYTHAPRDHEEQRGTLAVLALGYRNSVKVIFRFCVPLSKFACGSIATENH